MISVFKAIKEFILDIIYDRCPECHSTNTRRSVPLDGLPGEEFECLDCGNR